MLSRDEIKERLKGVDPKLCTAFALRCSLRIMPLLVKDPQQKPFGYWREDAVTQHLLDLFIAQQITGVSLMVPLPNSVIDAAAADAAAVGYTIYYVGRFGTASAATMYAAYAADAASHAAYAAAETTDVVTRTVDVITTYTTAAAITRTADATTLLNDFKELTNNPTTLSVDTWLARPLWPEGMPAEWRADYQRLQQAVRDLDAGFEVWLDWYQERIEGKSFDLTRETQWVQLPPEVREQGAKAVNAYLASLTETTRPLNRVRAIFIGDGAVGKTSLIRRLHGETVMEGKEAMTPGIDIRPWRRARCLYILLLDAGSEREQREQATANDRAEYWLEAGAYQGIW